MFAELIRREVSGGLKKRVRNPANPEKDAGEGGK